VGVKTECNQEAIHRRSQSEVDGNCPFRRQRGSDEANDNPRSKSGSGRIRQKAIALFKDQTDLSHRSFVHRGSTLSRRAFVGVPNG